VDIPSFGHGALCCAGKDSSCKCWLNMETGTCEETDIPRRGLVCWSRASRNLVVPDHGG
jgi:hypothetical protein